MSKPIASPATPDSDKETHTKRLLRLAEILAAVPDFQFNMDTWGEHGDDREPTPEQNYCGTSACALGWAALDGQFRADGLASRWVRDSDGWYLIVGDNHGPITTGAEFFGLTFDESDTLFGGHLSVREDVIAHIRELATDREELRS